MVFHTQLIFFLGGAGEGKRRSRVHLPERFFKGRSDSRQTSVMFQSSTSRRPVHTLTTEEGLLTSFRHGLHGTVGMIFDDHVVYVVICYMSFIFYMSVICLVQSPPQEPVVVVGYI
jgi:hypothetical protein